jgi:uncharacterized OB-fold protein
VSTAPSPPGARVCGSCGYTNVGPHDACLHCGAPLPARDLTLPGTVVGASPQPRPGTCRSCGNAVGPGDAFCAACGAPAG